MQSCCGQQASQEATERSRRKETETGGAWGGGGGGGGEAEGVSVGAAGGSVGTEDHHPVRDQARLRRDTLAVLAASSHRAPISRNPGKGHIDSISDGGLLATFRMGRERIMASGMHTQAIISPCSSDGCVRCRLIPRASATSLVVWNEETRHLSLHGLCWDTLSSLMSLTH